MRRFEDGKMQEFQIPQWRMRQSLQLYKMEDGNEGKGRGTLFSSIHHQLSCVGTEPGGEFNKGSILTNEYKGRRQDQRRWEYLQGNNYNGKPGKLCRVMKSVRITWADVQKVLRTLGYKCWKEVRHFLLLLQGKWENEGQCLVKIQKCQRIYC